MADKVHQNEPQCKWLCFVQPSVALHGGCHMNIILLILYAEMVVPNMAIYIVVLVCALCQPEMSFLVHELSHPVATYFYFCKKSSNNAVSILIFLYIFFTTSPNMGWG